MPDLNPEQQQSWKKRSGQIYNPQVGTILPTIEFEAPYRNKDGDPNIRETGFEGLSGYDITPIDANQAHIRITDASAVAEFLDGFWIVTPSKTVADRLPNVLNSVEVEFNKTIGDGATSFPVSQAYFYIFTRGSGSLSPKATAEGSASILPIFSYDLDEHFRVKLVNSTILTFFMPAETNLADILAKLSAKVGDPVLDWPDFNPKSHQVRLTGQQASVQASASSEASLGFTTDEDDGVTSETESSQWGNGYSQSNGVSVSRDNIPLAIHGAMTIDDNTDSATVSAQVEANTTDLEINGTPVVAAITNEPDPIEATANAKAVFENGTASVAATPGQSSIPTNGIYLVNIQAERDSQFDLVRVTAEIVDFSQYA